MPTETLYGYVPRWFSECTRLPIHVTNRAWRKSTVLIETNALSLSQTASIHTVRDAKTLQAKNRILAKSKVQLGKKEPAIDYSMMLVTHTGW